jgi:transcriptional antiterminator RfaH
MDIWLDRNWYAVQTKRRQEDVAAMNIGRMDIEVFLPKLKDESARRKPSRSAIKPLFPEYIFARFSPLGYLHSIRFARGVRRVVCAGGAPLPVGDEIVEAVRARVGVNGLVELEDTWPAQGDRVIINEGLLKGSQGILERELNGQERVAILLEAIGYQARVFVQKGAIGRIVPVVA